MRRVLEIVRKGFFVVAAAGLVMQREQAINAFPEAVEAGVLAEAERNIQVAAEADKNLRAAGLSPPPMLH